MKIIILGLTSLFNSNSVAVTDLRKKHTETTGNGTRDIGLPGKHSNHWAIRCPQMADDIKDFFNDKTKE